MSDLVWVHGGSLSPTDPALQEHPDAPAIFVFDQPFLSTHRIAFARLQFMYEAARSAVSPRALHRICVGVQAEEIIAYARETGCTRVCTTDVYSPELEQTLDALEAAGLEVVVYAPDRLTTATGPFKRFSAFWRKVEAEVLR
jgi:deoxyribodipyrimidine photo-lyase